MGGRNSIHAQSHEDQPVHYGALKARFSRSLGQGASVDPGVLSDFDEPEVHRAGERADTTAKII